MNSIGTKLKLLIEQKNIKQNQFADSMEISPSRLSNYLSDKRKPDLKSLAKMAKFLGVDLNYFTETDFGETNTTDSEFAHIDYMQISGNSTTKKSKVKINRFFLRNLVSPSDEAVLFKINKNFSIFKKGDFFLAKKLSAQCPNNTIVISTEAHGNVYNYFNHDNKHILVPFDGFATLSPQEHELYSYFAIIWMFYNTYGKAPFMY